MRPAVVAGRDTARAMSQENVEIIRRLNEAWAAGDLTAALEFMHPAIVWREPPEQPSSAEWHGHAGVEQSIRGWVGVWDDWRYEFEELTDAGDHILQTGSQSGRGKGSGARVASHLFHVWTLRDGLVVEMQMFMQREQALEAVGLQE